MMSVSISQINQLGERLRKAESPSEGDLRLLNDYRLSFDQAYQAVVNRIRSLELQVTGRPAKTTYSIVQKLQRERTRLSRMQDIAGCRIVVEGVMAQEETILLLRREFPAAKVSDRRLNPSHGYRAVHLIVTIREKPVEIQIRTKLQHLWAEYSEKCADVVDPALKYGGGKVHD